jgi:DNA-binding transcriptional ArsR family regulator
MPSRRFDVPDVDDKVAELVAERLRILGQPLRIRLIERLEEGPATVRELTEALSAVQQNVSQHLAVMHKAGVLERRKVGTRVFYEIGDSDAIRILEITRGALARQSRELARLGTALSKHAGTPPARTRT